MYRIKVWRGHRKQVQVNYSDTPTKDHFESYKAGDAGRDTCAMCGKDSITERTFRRGSLNIQVGSCTWRLYFDHNRLSEVDEGSGWWNKNKYQTNVRHLKYIKFL